MKKRLIFLLAALALTGCAAPAETAVDSLPAAAPVEPLSAPGIMTEGQIPAETCDLPTETVSLYDWQTSGEPLALLAEIPEEEMALYGVADGDAPHVLFR